MYREAVRLIVKRIHKKVISNQYYNFIKILECSKSLRTCWLSVTLQNFENFSTILQRQVLVINFRF